MTGAAVLVQVFTLYFLVLFFFLDPSEAQWLHADPLLKILPRQATLWFAPVLSLLLLVFWSSIQPPTKAIIANALKHSAYGIAVAIILFLTIRFAVGPNLPTFIPPEESVKPGYLLGMSAGLNEELIFRMVFTPLAFIAFLKWMRPHYAAMLSILVVALLFALFHELGSAGEPFSAYYFATRVLMPGCVMGLAFFYISPAFIVMMHSAAHIMIPLLFL